MRVYHTLIGGVLCCLLCSCADKITSCITAPATSSEHDRSIMLKAEAELEQVPVSGNVQTGFKDIVKRQFDTISNEDKALFLFLTAIDCYLQRGVVGEEVARQMAQLVRERWGARKGFSGTSPKTLEPIELRELSKTEDGKQILQLFRSLGLSG